MWLFIWRLMIILCFYKVDNKMILKIDKVLKFKYNKEVVVLVFCLN